MSTTPNSDHSPQSSFSEDLSDSLADGGLGEEIIRLRALLAEEQAKNKRMDKEVEEGRGKALELNRRCQDATRAYEQERKVCMCVCAYIYSVYTVEPWTR